MKQFSEVTVYYFMVKSNMAACMTLVQLRGPLLAAILELTITKYGDDKENNFLK